MRKTLRILAVGALLVSAGSLSAQTLYITGQAVNDQWNPCTCPTFTQDNGVFTYTLNQPGVFKISTAKGNDANDWDPFVRGLLVPKDYMADMYIEPLTGSFDGKIWGQDYDPGNYSLFYPGNYTLSVKKSDLSITVGFEPQTTNIEQWYVKGDFNGWEGGELDMKWEGDKYVMTGHFDNLNPEGGDHSFKIFNKIWQAFGCEQTITGYGTYTFYLLPGDIRGAVIYEPLADVDFRAEWSMSDIYHMTVTLSKGGAGVADISDDSNCETVYYTLDGMQVSRENLAPGIYVCRKGNSVSKIAIK